MNTTTSTTDTPRTDEARALAQDIGEERRIAWKLCRELERENAALRADKERLDWLFKHGQIRWPHRDRAAIDAAKKEAKP